jgi:orotate phosphoribosyltransferase
LLFYCIYEIGGTVEKDVARILLGIGAVTLRVDPPFKWASGILAPIYTDNRLLISYPEERRTIVTCLAGAMKREGLKPDVIAGTVTAGIPWAAWLSEKASRPMVYVRAGAKDHGKENVIEGRLEKGSHVVVVEDLISTGGSSISAVNAVRDAGAVVDAVLAIFTYGLKKASDNFRQAGCRLVTLCSFPVLVQAAADNGYISPAERSDVLAWSEDPENWGRK